MAVPRLLLHLVYPTSSSLLLANCKPSPLPVLNIGCYSRTISTAASQRDPPSAAAVDDFWRWLCEQGAVADSSAAIVKPGFVPEYHERSSCTRNNSVQRTIRRSHLHEGLGLVAQRDLPRKEVVVEVPKRLWIDSDTVVASEIGRLCAGLKPWVSIALFLLRERALGTASPWHPYLGILPPTPNSTIFWSEEELSEIEGTQLLSTAMGAKEYVESEFVKAEAEVILPNKHLFPSAITLLDFLWAFGILRSRAFSRGRGENLALVLLVDLINHSSSITQEDSSWEIKGKGIFSRELIFSLRTPVHVKSGEQVYIQYNIAKSNADLALDYGFVEQRPDRDAYTFTLEISESDPFYGDKLDIAESNGLDETAYFDIALGCPLTPLMLPYLQLVALGGADTFLLESVFRNTIWGHLELPVSRANEEAICHVVRQACKSALSVYHTTVEEDEKLMEGDNLDERFRIAVCVRAGEKKVLQQIDGAFRERESELDILEYYHERRLKDLGLLGLVGQQGEIIFWESK
ncbi:LOW QUALITY PROTEIN: fructose-bisphosphate aldolase-lysine N-methyltransferase, chloroplastic [Musa acuminata AAA Group]|uniref:LOW QUALITY PROTEIN: fructose-bisphosphate aldolase-lysine N-methyltransferase, chloroplastic n=1 Tax=Musa acuminata AAA Group TaxID=214697 RepID=UPI0031DD5B6D